MIPRCDVGAFCERSAVWQLRLLADPVSVILLCDEHLPLSPDVIDGSLRGIG